jgi:hypothetical protein
MKNKSYLRVAGVLAAAVIIMLALSFVARAQNGPGNRADQANQASPKIVIKQLEHNFGEIKKGAVAEHIFTFRNEGKADLQIRNVAPS